jgi:hypothetical protein
VNEKEGQKCPISVKLLEKLGSFSAKVFLLIVFKKFPNFASVASQLNIPP